MPYWFPVAMTITAVVAMVASLWMVYWSGETEPFFGPFNLRHAAISLVGGGVGLLFWIAWGGLVVLAVRNRWVPTIPLALMLLVLFGLLLNGIVVYSYLGDRHNWIENGPF